ncbi:Acetolactate synthase large subunit [Geodia barretti]|uniref:acetolactate synthase n=1 Tax=Geodia barretti TaxID=519541 RepID=A0AA35TUI4_GEOBA|nr:Acetolactate synthase large subunit [Geodia barretti]
MELSGAQILVDSLKREGVEYIFGVNGGAAMPIFDALYGETEVKLIPMRHEQGASHAADGYARATGNVGVVLATSGPGATNLVTGIATAYMDSIPMLRLLDSYKPQVHGDPAQIAKAVALIKEAKCPMIYAGGGVVLANASEELQQFTLNTQIPITVTLMGLGAFPETHPLAMEMPGMHGSCCANYAFTDSDLVIAVGARFDDRVTGDLGKFAPNAKKIHIDIDASCIGKNVPIDVPIVGDAKNVLTELNKQVSTADIDPWRDQIQEWKQKYPFEYEQKSDIVMPQFVIEKIYEHYSDAIVVADVGQHQMWAAQYFKFTEPRQWLNLWRSRHNGL